MKQIKLYVLLLMMCSLVFLQFSTYPQVKPDVDWEKVPFGKVTGWIVNPDTGKHVDEEFIVYFFFINNKFPEKPIYFDAESSNKGYFTSKLVEGKYYVQAVPKSNKNYCSSPNPLINWKQSPTISIIEGKITKISFKASIGGNLKVILVGPNQVKLVPEEIFEDKKFNISITRKGVGSGISISNTANPSDDKSVVLFNNYPPGIYKIGFNTNASLMSSHKENILIESRKTTEFKFMIDLDTGIEGIVNGTDGLPMKSVAVNVFGRTNPHSTYTYTNDSGYYKILAIEEGYYDIRYSIEDDNNEFFGGTLKNIFIKKNSIMKLDYVLKMIKLN